jgi:hypothetical protein
MDDVKAEGASPLREWVEPDVSELAVADTALVPARGADGNLRFVDCTRS